MIRKLFNRMTAPAAHEATIFSMDTVMYLSAYGAGAKDAVAAGIKIIDRLNLLLSLYDPKSDFSRLNAAASGAEVKLLEDTADVVRQALYFAWLTEGAFNPAIAPLAMLWQAGSGAETIPDPENIRRALALCDYNAVEYRGGNRFVVHKNGVKLDLGGIAKGFASQKVMEQMRALGIRSAYISLGGNVAVLGKRPDGCDWPIGIADVDHPDDYFGIVHVRDAYVITSGDYERYFEQGGVRYHHLLDARTGYPLRSGLRSVSVIADNGTRADALSTALFSMGLEKGLDFQRQAGNFEAVFVTDQKNVVCTSGISDKFEFQGTEKGYTFP
ncbi:FAD:protein FMN transferase [Ethanoligenens sp.]|uniref:FAD:protein FMN transferase n=1 Tax=Ethanoligenens sp. TaxID=2099655 RepID=UPI0039EADFC5